MVCYLREQLLKLQIEKEKAALRQRLEVLGLSESEISRRLGESAKGTAKIAVRKLLQEGKISASKFAHLNAEIDGCEQEAAKYHEHEHSHESQGAN